MAYIPQQRQQHIKELQKMLYGLSFFDERIPVVYPDGIYGRETAFAVRAFQHTNGLRPTGEVNSATWEKIRDEYKEKIGKSASPLHAFPPNTINISINDEGLAVYIIQVMLKLLNVSFGNFADIEITGRYDPATERAVREFQRRSGQPQTGKTDMDTWNLLVATSHHEA